MDGFDETCLGGNIEIGDRARFFRLRQPGAPNLTETYRWRRGSLRGPRADCIAVIINQVTAGGAIQERKCIDRGQSRSWIKDQRPTAAIDANIRPIKVDLSFQRRRSAALPPSHASHLQAVTSVRNSAP